MTFWFRLQGLHFVRVLRTLALYNLVGLPETVCQILDSRQECRLVTVLKRHLERIFAYKSKWNYTLGLLQIFWGYFDGH